MPCSNRPTELLSPEPAEQGSAAIEVLVLGVLLLVPLVYLVLTVAALQGAAFAAEGAARQAARSIVLAPDEAAGRDAAAAAIAAGLADWRLPEGSAAVEVQCTPEPDACLTPRGTVTVRIRVAVALPLLPPALAVNAPGTVPVAASASQRVSMFTATP